MGEGRRGEPSDGPQANQRLTVAQAAAKLSITEGAVRSRIKRGTLPTTREGGTVYVLWGDGTSETNHQTSYGEPHGVPADQSELVESLQDQVAFLRAELERRGEEADRYQRIVAGLAQANANLSERVRELEPAQTGQESPQESAEAVTRGDDDRPAAEGQETAPRRPWWRRVFGG